MPHVVVCSSVAEAELEYQTGNLGNRPSRGIEAGALGLQTSDESYRDGSFAEPNPPHHTTALRTALI